MQYEMKATQKSLPPMKIIHIISGSKDLEIAVSVTVLAVLLTG